MPFLGKDWRSCGEQWIKTEDGWERSKIIENILDGLNSRSQIYKTKKKCKSNQESGPNSYFFDELDSSTEDESEDEESTSKEHLENFKKLSITNKQPHIIYRDRESNVPKPSISEVLTALDMAGAVRDTKRFNYACRLVQIIINERLTELSGNAQRTLFMIVKQMVINVVKTQENLNTMKKLLSDLKKKIQECIYFYFYHVGSQKLCDKHLAKISKWQEILENPNHKRVKRLRKGLLAKHDSNAEAENIDFDSIPVDCKLEIFRRLNSGLDLINLSMCSKNFNNIITKELVIWKNLCQFHFQQTHINSFFKNSKSSHKVLIEKNENEANKLQNLKDIDWKEVYFKLKKRYGHREVYVDMVLKCVHCKSLFWREIGHPCLSKLEIQTEPITPKKLIDLLLK